MPSDIPLISESKKTILTSNGFTYSIDHEIYFNKATKKIFSDVAISDHDEHWLKKCIEEEISESWQFYFNPFYAPNETIKNEIIHFVKSHIG